MIRSTSRFLIWALLLSSILSAQQAATPATPAAFVPPDTIFGYRNPATELQAEKAFLAVPDPMLAKQHLQFLTSAPHVAGSPEDKRNAEYVLDKYKAAGLDAYIQPYKVWMGLPLDIRVDVVAPEGVVMHGPSPERVSDDPSQKDARILPAFNEYSPSGDVTGFAASSCSCSSRSDSAADSAWSSR